MILNQWSTDVKTVLAAKSMVLFSHTFVHKCCRNMAAYSVTNEITKLAVCDLTKGNLIIARLSFGPGSGLGTLSLMV